jgi:hypothetical protein
MKTEIIHISKKVHFDNSFRSVISFNKFIEFLKTNIRSGPSIKIPYFKWIVKKFKKLPELSRNIPIEKISAYEEMLELVSTCLLPLAADEKSLWALSSPLSPEIFYSTDGFYELMNTLKHPAVLNPSEGNADSESENIIHELQYGMVLEKIYNSPYLKKTEWVRKFEDPETGLDKYLLVNIDTRFISIRPIQQFPVMDCSSILPSSVWGEEFKKIQQLISLDLFEASGFSVITLTDVTAQQAVEEIGRLIVNNAYGDPMLIYERITHLLQTIAGSRDYQFGVVPFLKINDRPALLYENFPFSIIVQACWQSEVSKKEFTSFRNNFSQNPKTIVWSTQDKENKLPEVISDAFLHTGIRTYIMFPVYHNDQLTGIFEICTKNDTPMISEGQLIKLKPALPLITQLIQNGIARFNASIEDIVKEQFTSIQPAVQWKFTETAWHYLRDHVLEDTDAPVENIIFRNLSPLFGAVDIRNSTILRNQALRKDFAIQLSILTDIVSALDYTAKPQLERILAYAKNWQQIIRDPLTTQQEIRLNEFFNLDVQAELENLLRDEPDKMETILPYFQSIDEENGIAFENRRHLEDAIKQLNSAVNNFYENASDELQQIFPCYFEKFRTDGVEYDIYVGQSIAPKSLFQKQHLQDMKRWQLESMIKVVRLVQELLPDMVFPLQTTQLIFVHPQTIDITFRKDERRFDVEGAYNIRYQVIKKRIDKVLILDSNERLTQPGKIALVYFEDRDADEYKGFINQLQEENLLMNDLEELELESLQGVDGLKALRVGVRIQESIGETIDTNEFEKTT